MMTASSRLSLISLIVDDYEKAIEYFTTKLNCSVTEDKAALTNDGRPKRWVVIHQKGQDAKSTTGILLAQADGEEQTQAVGKQWAGRVGMFLVVDNFDVEYERMLAAGVDFMAQPRVEDYGKVVVFKDLWGNKWDLIQMYD